MLKNKLINSPEWVKTLFAAVAAFSTYLCFYPFRRAYTAATFEDLYYFGIHFKILIITAQVVGFAVSKGIGVKVVSEMKPQNRPRNLLIIIGLSLLCYFFFAITPAPYNLVFMFLASLPLGMVYGVVLGFLELALALKFLSTADQVYHWHILDREVYLALCIAIF